MTDEQCKYTVYIRDTYRYSGGKQKYKMHYIKRRCSRKAVAEQRCWQHPRSRFPNGDVP